MACWVCRRLNPCFSGGWSRSLAAVKQEAAGESLNPCFSGGWSRRLWKKFQNFILHIVLILVLVEDGLGEDVQMAYSHTALVLILVLVEDGLGELLLYRRNAPLRQS